MSAEKLNVFGFVFLFIICLILSGGWVQMYMENCDSRVEVGVWKSRVTNVEDRLEIIEQTLKPMKQPKKREVVGLSGTQQLLDLIKSVKGVQGPPGTPGAPGKDGKDGRDGRDAVNLASVDRYINSSVSQAMNSALKRIEKVMKTVPAVSGAVYIRYGRTSCPSQSKMLYKGRLGGTYYTNKGGSSQYICLPDDPEYSSNTAKNPYSLAMISGTEYENPNTRLLGKDVINHNVPCVVCEAGHRANKVILPAKLRCPDSSWTLEYKGFLMSEGNWSDRYRTEYICLDEHPEVVSGMQTNQNGALIYHTTVNCDNFGHCPPYHTNRELTCAVCTK